MTILYISEPGGMLRRDGFSLIVTVDLPPEKSGSTTKRRVRLANVEPHLIETVFLVGHCSATTDAVCLCLEKGISLAWMDHGGRLLGRLVPPLGRSAESRIGQYRLAMDMQARMTHARVLIRAKLNNAVETLRQLQSNRSGRPELAVGMTEIRHDMEAIDSTVDAAALMGVEGAATRAYFAAFGSCFSGAITFTGRARRPPPDPANALLSFGYVLLTNLLTGCLEGLGLDSAIGFLHELRPGRPSLALDVVEEMRHPLVDRFVLRLCNLGVMKPNAFEADEDRPGGVRLIRDGLKRFLAEWEEWLDRPIPERDSTQPIAPRALIRRQAERISVDLRGGEPYQPFLFRG
ncbi:CRISPR-associated endonuclease Cas1 3 [Azospirillaceae bacterium]